MRGPWSHSEHYNPSFRNWAVDLTFIYFRFPMPYKMNSIIETYWVIVKIKYYSVCWMLHFKLYKNIHPCVKYYPFPKYFLEEITITSNFMGIKAISKLFFFQKFSAFFFKSGNILFGFFLYPGSESVSTFCFIITTSLKIKMKQYYFFLYCFLN